MGRKRTGSVFEKDGALWYSFLLRSGKKHTKRVPPLPDGRVATKEQARTYKDELLRRYELGLWDPEAPNPLAPREPAPAAPVPTVAEYGERWQRGLTHDSRFNEELFVRRYVRDSELGAQPITEVTPPDVLAWVRTLRGAASTKGGTLAPQTVRAFYGKLKRMFAHAVFERVLAATPCVLPAGSLPKGTDKVPGARKHWKRPRAEAEALISDVRVPEGRRVLWALLLCGGLRAGEAFALRWQDYDSARGPLGCLAVDRAWSSRHRHLKTTKTEASREVPVHPTLAAILAQWKLSGWARAHGRPPTPGDLIAPNAKGKPRGVTAAGESLRNDCRALELPHRRLHGMRHTFISLCIDDGARADVIAKVTHTRPTTTAFDLYRQESWETLCAEVSKLKIRRIPDALPLWKAASGGGGEQGGAMGNATDSATVVSGAREMGLRDSQTHESLSPSKADPTAMNDPMNAPLDAATSLATAIRDGVRAEVDDVEVLVSCADRTSYTVENDDIIPALEVGAWTVAVRALAGGRLATAATTSRDPGDTVRALRLALGAAQPDALGAFAVTAAARDTARFADPRAWALVDEPATLRAMATALRDGARSVRGGVVVDAEVSAGRSVRAVVTGRGEVSASASTYVSAFAMLDGNDWDAWSGVARPDDLAVTDLARSLLAELPTRDLTCEGFFGGPREVTVVLHPRLVETLLRALFLERVALDRVLAGLSSAAPGGRVAHASFSLYDDTAAAASLRGDVTDDEGVSGARRAVVEGGALASLPNDRRSAAARGVAPTGNGFRIPILAEDRAEAPVRVGFGHLEVPAGDVPRASLARGKSVLVTDLLGVHSANKATGAFNNPIQGGVCLEDGVPVARVKPGAWSVTGNLHAMLRELAGLSRERLATGGALLPWVAAAARVA